MVSNLQIFITDECFLTRNPLESMNNEQKKKINKQKKEIHIVKFKMVS